MPKARANQAEFAAKFHNDVEIAKGDRDYKLQKATYDIEIQTKKVTCM